MPMRKLNASPPGALCEAISCWNSSAASATDRAEQRSGTQGGSPEGSDGGAGETVIGQTQKLNADPEARGLYRLAEASLAARTAVGA
mgnify:CR=1 FL=1